MRRKKFAIIHMVAIVTFGSLLGGITLARSGPGSTEFYRNLPENIIDCGSSIDRTTDENRNREIRSCFTKSFSTCKPAKIHETYFTIEGDPITMTAVIEKEQDGSCSVRLYSDTSRDRFGSGKQWESVCSSVELNEEYHIEYKSISLVLGDCQDGGERKLLSWRHQRTLAELEDRARKAATPFDRWEILTWIAKKQRRRLDYQTNLKRADVEEMRRRILAAADAARMIHYDEMRRRALGNVVDAIIDADKILAQHGRDAWSDSREQLRLDVLNSVVNEKDLHRLEGAFVRLTRAQLRAGELYWAAKFAAMLQPKPTPYFRAMATIVRALAQAGDLKNAQLHLNSAAKRVWKSGSPTDIGQALVIIAGARIDIGDRAHAGRNLTVAIGIAKPIKDRRARSEILLNVARLQAKLGEMDAAVSTMRWLRKPRDIWRAWRVVAEEYLNQSKTVESQHALLQAVIPAKSLRHAIRRTYALRTIADVQMRADAAEGAKRTLSQAFELALTIKTLRARWRELRKIYIAQARAGDIDGALKTMASIGDNKPRSRFRTLPIWALFQIADGQREADNMAAALETLSLVSDAANEIGHAETRMQALMMLGTRYHQAANSSGARSALTRALDAARSIESSQDTRWPGDGRGGWTCTYWPNSPATRIRTSRRGHSGSDVQGRQQANPKRRLRSSSPTFGRRTCYNTGTVRANRLEAGAVGP